MRKVVSPILSAAILGGALLLCPPSYAAPTSMHSHDEPTVFQAPTKFTCSKVMGLLPIC